MAQRIPRWLTAVMGVVLALPFALRWLFTPASASAEVGISLGGPAAFSHMRGDTGGAFFVVGALLLLGLYRKEPGYLEAVALIMVGIVAGRSLGIALDGYLNQIGIAMAVEFVTAAAAFATARQMRSASP
jgi:Domain of unknown function (DUF4345)